MLRALLAASVIAMTATPAFAQESIVNGGFESPTVSDPCCVTSPPVPIPGWTATPNVNIVNGTFSSSSGNLAGEGTQYLDLVGEGGTGSISQTFATMMGETYNISFLYSHNLFSGTPSASASFSVDGLFGTISHSTGTNADLDWQTYFGSFVADGSSATLTFTNLTGGRNEGILLDAVSVAAVPEPGTWAMMLLGFGGIGLAMRRSNRKRGYLHAIA